MKDVFKAIIAFDDFLERHGVVLAVIFVCLALMVPVFNAVVSFENIYSIQTFGVLAAFCVVAAYLILKTRDIEV